MPDTKCCAECGAPLPAYWPRGLCAQCALDGALDMTNAASQVHQPEAPTTPASLQPPPLSAETSPVGSFGDYDLLEEIARGGMGVVYKARQRKLGRIVAVKMIQAGPLPGKEFVQRFRTESAAAAILQHPNIVAIHDVGIHEGRHYFSMDYVEGQNLTQRVGQQPLPANKAARYVELIAEAIHYAHERGILHRDLKPSNVLIDANDQPRITDFGLARRLDGESSLTLTGQVLGSPNFMPPEQAGLKGGKVGRPSDVYALGGILYHLLTARAPFQAESLEGIITQVLNAEPVSPRLLNPSIPKDLETITLKCLEKEPSRRYQSAQELADELGRFLRHEPIHARPVSRVERAWRWCQRNRPLALTGAAVIILLVTLAIGSPIAAFRINRERVQAEAARQNETQLRREAQAQELVSRQNAYASDTSAAYHALEEGNFGLARKLLTGHRPQPGQQDLRGFEWRYLWGLSQGEQLRTLLGHSNYVRCLAYSPDGKTLASGSFDHTVKLWNPDTGQLIATCAGHSGEVISVAFSQDGQLMASGGNEGLVRLWDARSRQIVSTLTNQGPYTQVAFSGRLLALGTGGDVFGNDGGIVKLWDYVAKQDVMSLTNSGNRVALSPDGKTVATANWEGLVKLWDVASGREPRRFPSRLVVSLAFSPDSRWLAWSTDARNVCLWDLTEPEPTCLENGVEYKTFSLAFSPDGKTLATGNGNDTIFLWNVLRREKVDELRGHGGPIWALAFSPDGRSLASGSLDDTIMLWDLARRRTRGVITNVVLNEFHHVGHPVFSPDSRILATPARTGGIVLWEVDTCQAAARLETDFLPVAFSPDGGTLLARDEPFNTLQQWDLSTKTLRGTTPLSTIPVDEYSADAFSWDHQMIATSHKGEKRIILRSALTGEFLFELQGLEPTRSLAFSPDGRLLATGHPNGTAELWDLTTHRSIFALGGFRRDVSSFAFSAGGRFLAAGSWDGSIKVCDIVGKKELAPLTGHKEAVSALAFSPDGKTLAGAGHGGFQLWNLATGREVIIFTFKAFVEGVSVKFSPDGRTLAAGGDVNLHLWRAPTLSQIDAADKVNRPQ